MPSIGINVYYDLISSLRTAGTSSDMFVPWLGWFRGMFFKCVFQTGGIFEVQKRELRKTSESSSSSLGHFYFLDCAKRTYLLRVQPGVVFVLEGW